MLLMRPNRWVGTAGAAVESASAPLPVQNGTVGIHLPQLARAAKAVPPRTLVQVFEETAQQVPDASALDDGKASRSYTELRIAAKDYALRLQNGIGSGDKVGIRIPSGTNELYIAILATLLMGGAAYVPVDADDPEERASLVYEEAGVAAILRPGEISTVRARFLAACQHRISHWRT